MTSIITQFGFIGAIIFGLLFLLLIKKQWAWIIAPICLIVLYTGLYSISGMPRPIGNKMGLLNERYDLEIISSLVKVDEAIYLYVKDDPPMSYVLPYSKELDKELHEKKAQLQPGEKIRIEGSRLEMPSVRIEQSFQQEVKE